MHTAFEALHFPITTHTDPEFPNLPMTRISAGITTTRPSDAVIIQSAELTGMDAFEEVVKVETFPTCAIRSRSGCWRSRVSRRPSWLRTINGSYLNRYFRAPSELFATERIMPI